MMGMMLTGNPVSPDMSVPDLRVSATGLREVRRDSRSQRGS
jgi:hypothetical protein